MPITKICKKCCLEKQLVDFYRNNKMKDGYINHCKECNDIKTKECRLKNQVKNKETRKNTFGCINCSCRCCCINYWVLSVGTKPSSKNDAKLQ